MRRGRLEFGLACVAVFLAPINVLKLPDFYFTASDAVVLLCLASMLARAKIRPVLLGPGTAFWVGGLCLAVGALLASSLVAGAIDRGIILGAQYLFAYLLVPMVLLGREWRQTEILLKVFVASMVIMVLHGIYVVDYVGETFTTFVSGAGRLKGFLERENECGSVLALTVPIVLAMAAMGMLRPLTVVVITGLLGYGVMLTGSNTALYSMLFGVLMFVVASLTLRRLVFCVCGLALFWSVITVPVIRDSLPATFQRRVLIGLESGDLNDAGTFADRMVLNREALQLAGDSLLIGKGADQYREISDLKAPVHNIYLLLWNEGGSLAPIGFLLMLCGAGVTIAMTWRHRAGRIIAVGGFSTVALFAILINATPHVYGRFWAFPVVLSLAPAVAFLMYGPPPAKRNAR